MQPRSLACSTAQTVSTFGGIDILINNAATALAQPLGEITPQAWDKSISVNLTGPLFLVWEALLHLERSDHAAILNVVSAGAFMFSPVTSMYSVGKSALMSLTRSMAAAFVSRGIRVNALAPGPIDTDMVRANTPDFIDMLQHSSLMQRIADPDEMAARHCFSRRTPAASSPDRYCWPTAEWSHTEVLTPAVARPRGACL